jgi:2-polyprenyl-6-methoxyphenol hydroxylase-like FAD-dependent oxidoreductase
VTKAVVIGGGIGGLTAAISLRRAGVEAVVFERSPELREVGAGIALWANATKALRKLGLYEAVRDRAAEIGGETRTWLGRRLFAIPAEAMRSRFGEANLVMHRADLQAALLAAQPDDAVRLGANLESFSQDGEAVVAHFSEGREETADFLVGADGLRSTVRARLLDDGPPRYAGFTAWRGIAEGVEGLVPDGVGLNLWGRGMEFGLISIGRGRAYWYLTKNVPEGGAEAPCGRKEEVLGHLRGWYGAARAAVEATEDASILRNDIFDREPVWRWGEGRATLLGDAAHPMTPNLGQGACQAIEDAVVLGASVRGTRSAASLRSYEARRIQRTGVVVRASRSMARVLQIEAPLLCGVRDAVVRRMPGGVRMGRLDPIVGYEV